MTFTIELGWWLIPLVVTVTFYGIAISRFEHGGGDYSFPEIANLFRLLLATIPILIAWLIWALVV